MFRILILSILLLVCETPRTLAAAPTQFSATQEVQRYSSVEANQGVIVDDEHFYAIDNHRIGKYRKHDGIKVTSFNAIPKLQLKHLNAGFEKDGQLYLAHSNFPELPEINSLEIFDAKTLQPLRTQRLEGGNGSLTWIVPFQEGWLACFAYYAKKGETYSPSPRIVHLDRQFATVKTWTLPIELCAKFGRHSSSGGSIGNDQKLYLSGHDATELYVLDILPDQDSLSWIATIPTSIPGQAFSFDPHNSKRVFGIDRKKREIVIVDFTHISP